MRIELRNVLKSYRSVRALDHVSLDIDPGQIVSLLGPNGAGKTSMLRCLAGIAAPDKGGVYLDEQEFRRDQMDLRRRMHLLPDFPFHFWEHSVIRNIAIVLRIFEADGEGAEKRVLDLLREFDLLPLALRPVGSLSRGQSYKAGLVALLAADREVCRRGWLENFLWRMLNPRERALVEFVFPDGVNIAAPWKKTFRNLTVTGLSAFAAGFVAPVARIWILGGGGFVTLCQVLAQLLTTGRAFQLVKFSGVNIPLYAGYAIGFRELARVLFKHSLAQFPLLIPFAVVSGMLVSHLANLPLSLGALFGLKASGLLIASRFIFIVFSFSAGSNDTSTVRFRSLALILLAVAFCLGFVALGAASLFVSRQHIAWLLWGLASVEAYAFLRVYGWFYHTNRFDLMSLPRS